MRSFQNIAKLIRNKRLSHPKGYSQSELSHLLGYKNGQFISNVERALCNIPLKMLNKVSEILDIDKNHLKETILKDHEKTLEIYLNESAQILHDTNLSSPLTESKDSTYNNYSKYDDPNYNESIDEMNKKANASGSGK